MVMLSSDPVGGSLRGRPRGQVPRMLAIGASGSTSSRRSPPPWARSRTGMRAWTVARAQTPWERASQAMYSTVATSSASTTADGSSVTVASRVTTWWAPPVASTVKRSRARRRRSERRETSSEMRRGAPAESSVPGAASSWRAITPSPGERPADSGSSSRAVNQPRTERPVVSASGGRDPAGGARGRGEGGAHPGIGGAADLDLADLARPGPTRRMRCALVSATSQLPSGSTLTEPGSFNPESTVLTSPLGS